MSFSSDVKKELCSIEQTSYCCRRAEAYGMLFFARAFGIDDISLMTDYDFVAERYKEAISFLIQSEPEITVSKSGKYTVSVTDINDRMDILNELGYSGKERTNKKSNVSGIENHEIKHSYSSILDPSPLLLTNTKHSVS